MPQSARDLHPLGVLVTGAAGQPTPVERGHAYGCIARRLYLPVEAVLCPAVSDAELEGLLGSSGRVWVWHPVAGLVAFDPDDTLRVGDLLRPPREDASDWGRALPGLALPRRLLSVEADAPLTCEGILEEGRDDIGTQAPSLDALPETPDEPRPGAVGELCRRAQGAVARMVQGLAGRLAGAGAAGGAAAAGAAAGGAMVGGAMAGWLARAGEWAARQLAALQAADLAARNRELHRLIRLLEKNPDEGLRYALPRAGGDHRGLAAASNRLPRRDVDFSLGRLGGGGPVDAWEVDTAQGLRLEALYRALAAREIRLGRHRRAAYVYAELLGDLESAASVLKAGGHFREAAVLYRERLNRPHAAAECLVQAGLLTDAIALYEELKDFERAGDLYARLDRPDEARDCYRRAVERCYAGRDYLGAAGLSETKLADPDAALRFLHEGWETNMQAAACLDATFGLLGRLGRHDDAVERVEALARRPASPLRTPLVVDGLADVATGYPEPRVQLAAADATRVAAGRRLPAAPHDERQRLVAAVGRLATQDRLLQRDCQRFIDLARERDAQRQLIRRPRRGTPTLLHEIRLPESVAWCQAVAAGPAFYLAGWRRDAPDRLVVARGFWEIPDAVPDALEWRVRQPHADGDDPVLLAADPADRHPVLLHVPGRPPLGPQRFPRHAAGHAQVIAGAPPWLQDRAVALARAPHGLAWSLAPHEDGGSIVLTAAGPMGELVTSRVLPVPRRNPGEETVRLAMEVVLMIPMHARSEAVFFALRQDLVWYDLRGGKGLRTATLPDSVRGLAGSPPHTRLRVVAACAHGGAVYFDDAPAHQRLQRFGEDLEKPAACFTLNGWLVAASDAICELYRTDEARVRLQAALPDSGRNPFAVLPSARPNCFGLCTEDGTIRVFRTP